MSHPGSDRQHLIASVANLLNAAPRVDCLATTEECEQVLLKQLEVAAQIVDLVRRHEAGGIAYHIEAELVCCDIFERLEATYPDQEAWAQLRGSPDYHAICHYGGWAAHLARSHGGASGNG